jgi:hypothetical protein
VKCELCGRDKTEAQGIVLTLSEAERDVLFNAVTPKDVTSVFYCKPCHRVLIDPKDGPKVLAGIMETKLRVGGMAPNRAEMLGNQLYKNLLDKATKKDS